MPDLMQTDDVPAATPFRVRSCGWSDAAAALSSARRPIEQVVCEGDPAREIVKSARTRDVDLVVLGARGLRTLGRLLLGSVSETVVHHVGRPVVIVRERDESVR